MDGEGDMRGSQRFQSSAPPAPASGGGDEWIPKRTSNLMALVAALMSVVGTGVAASVYAGQKLAVLERLVPYFDKVDGLAARAGVDEQRITHLEKEQDRCCAKAESSSVNPVSAVASIR